MSTQLHGDLLIGASRESGQGDRFYALDPSTDQTLQPGFASAGADDIARACALAAAASDPFRHTSADARAEFLECIAVEIDSVAAELTERGVQETGLPAARLNGERGRTTGQLRLFANLLHSGNWADACIEPALPQRQPLPRPDMHRHAVGIGPVAVFGASNFPLAFSVAGGDTASALAAGCPVVMKGHPAHPGVSELVASAIVRAVQRCGLPEGVFSLLSGPGNDIGAALVSDARIKAVGFTGSRRGGLALQALAQRRPEPIPVFAEMSSINPVFLLPAALAQNAEQIAEGYVASLTLGAGQFCTNPGLLVAQAGADMDRFLDHAGAQLAGVAAHTMLTPAIARAYDDGCSRWAEHPMVKVLALGAESNGPNQGQARLYGIEAHNLLDHPELMAEVFGPAGLVVRCRDEREMRQVAAALDGQLTATLHLAAEDYATAPELIRLLEDRAGRLLCNGFPTGVDVGHAMVHGGPYPATTDSRTTSVGSTAIRRFLRPVCYQDFPTDLLPFERLRQ